MRRLQITEGAEKHLYRYRVNGYIYDQNASENSAFDIYITTNKEAEVTNDNDKTAAFLLELIEEEKGDYNKIPVMGQLGEGPYNICAFIASYGSHGITFSDFTENVVVAANITGSAEENPMTGGMILSKIQLI